MTQKGGAAVPAAIAAAATSTEAAAAAVGLEWSRGQADDDGHQGGRYIPDWCNQCSVLGFWSFRALELEGFRV